ncbi:hypothetical protein ACWPKO_29540 (plasmid) [Coraliomargarita sp. W4R53]
MNRWAQWCVGVGLVAAAWGVAAITPPDSEIQAPFVAMATLEQPIEGRNIAATINEVKRVSRVSEGGWSADGNWLVIDLDVSATTAESSALFVPTKLMLAEFTVGGYTYGATERAPSLWKHALAVGIPRSGSIAFELPSQLDEGIGVLSLGENTDSRLDSVIEMSIDLSTLSVEAESALVETQWSTP